MTELQGVMTRAEFESTREFSRCSAKQKRYLQALIENGGDPVQATVAAFNCASVANAHIYSFAVRRSPKIQAALNLFLGKSDRDLLLEKVRYNIKRADPGSVAMSRLLAQEERLIVGIKPPAEDEPEVPTPAVNETSSSIPIFPPATSVADSRVPADALKVWLDKDGGIVGYRAIDGQDVRF